MSASNRIEFIDGEEAECGFCKETFTMDDNYDCIVINPSGEGGSSAVCPKCNRHHPEFCNPTDHGYCGHRGSS